MTRRKPIARTCQRVSDMTDVIAVKPARRTHTKERPIIVLMPAIVACADSKDKAEVGGSESAKVSRVAQPGEMLGL